MPSSVAPKTAIGSRPRSLGNNPITRAERLELIKLTVSLAKGRLYANRPRTWGECKERIVGPCPWVSCRHHLAIEFDEFTQCVKVNFPDREVDELAETCSLRVAELVAEQGGLTYQGVGDLLNLTLERGRQLEDEALVSFKRHLAIANVTPAFRAAMARLMVPVAEPDETPAPDTSPEMVARLVAPMERAAPERGPETPGAA